MCLTYSHGTNTHLVVVWAEVFEVTEAGEAQADYHSDEKDHQGEERRWSPETCNMNETLSKDVFCYNEISSR